MGSSSVQQPRPSPTFNGAQFVPTKLWFNNTNTNFGPWRAQMLCLIESEGLLSFIDGTAVAPPPATVDYETWKRADSLLKGWILCTLNEDIVYTVNASKTTRELWLDLTNRHRRLFNLGPPIPIDGATAAPTAKAIADEEDKNTKEKGWTEYLPLHRAIIQGNWDAVKQILENDPRAITASLNLGENRALHFAVGTVKAIHIVEQLVAALPDDESIALKDCDGTTALATAAFVGNTAAATILVNRLPNLLYIPNNFGNFPVHVAAMYAHRDMLKYLISVTKHRDCSQNPYAGLAGLRLLLFVIDAQFFDIALELVEKYPYLARLKLSDNSSALKNIAASKSVLLYGRGFNFMERFISSCVLDETASSRPRFANGCDIQSLILNFQAVLQSLYAMLWKSVGRLGMIKNIRDKMLQKQQALQLMKLLCKEIESLSFEEARQIYFDAILVAAPLGINEIVEDVVEIFPSAIHCIIPGLRHLIFHMSVENRSERIYNLIYQMSDHKHFYSDLMDSNGNNLLHLAGKLAPSHKLNEIPGAALQMQREIQWFKEVEKFVHPHSRKVLNYAGKSAKMIFTEEHKILKEQGEGWMKDTSNSYIIAASLIVTVMFAAAITVPGGNDGSSGLPILYDDPAFIVFAISDAVSLFTSATSLLMFLSILTSRYAEEDFLYVLPRRLIIGLATLFLSITFMMVAFSATMYLVFGRKEAWVLIPAAGLACLPVTSFVLLQFPLLVDLLSFTYGKGIFRKQSDRPFY